MNKQDMPDYNPRYSQQTDIREAVRRIWLDARKTPRNINATMREAGQTDDSQLKHIFGQSSFPYAIFNAQDKTITTYVSKNKSVKLTQEELINLIK